MGKKVPGTWGTGMPLMWGVLGGHVARTNMATLKCYDWSLVPALHLCYHSHCWFRGLQESLNRLHRGLKEMGDCLSASWEPWYLATGHVYIGYGV